MTPRRILCLVDPAGPGGGATTLSLCRRAVDALVRAGAVVEIGLLGQVEADAFARACGIDAAWRVPVPCGRESLARRAVARACAGTAPTAVLGWGERACAIASRSLDSAPLVAVLDAPFPAPRVRRSAMAQALCVGQALADRAMEAGWLPIRVRSVQPPMPPWLADPSTDRNSLRRAWNAPPEDFVIGVLPLSPGRGDALFAFHAMGRCALAGHGAHLVLDPALGQACTVRPLARQLGLNERVHFDAAIRRPWTLAPAVDFWISLADAASDETASHAAAAAALGAPILAAANSLACSSVEHRVDGFIAEANVNAYAHEMIQAAHDRALCRIVAEAARVRHAGRSVREVFDLAVQECVDRACPLGGAAAADERLADRNASAAPA